LLRALGARTIGTASTQEKIEMAKKNGADVAVNYKEENDLAGKVLDRRGGVMVVFDTEKDQFDTNLEVFARKGSLVSYGNSASGLVFLGGSAVGANQA
jgi:NADPH2:quinone reductase